MADKVAIVTDSVACIPHELVEEYGIEVVAETGTGTQEHMNRIAAFFDAILR